MSTRTSTTDAPRFGSYYPAITAIQALTGVSMTLFPLVSHAYVGPGAGLTMLGALWAVILAVVFVIGGLLMWPIKALMRKRKAGKPGENSAADTADQKPDNA